MELIQRTLEDCAAARQARDYFQFQHSARTLHYAVAEYIALHLTIVLTGVIAVALAAAAIFWRLVERYGAPSWAWALRHWRFLRQTTHAARIKRWPVIGPTLSSVVAIARSLGIVAVIGLCVAATAIVLFFEIADEIGVDESLATFDVALSDALRQHVSHEALRLFAVITQAGDTNVVITLSVLVSIYLFMFREKLVAIAWLLATASGGLLIRVLKATFERTRPVHEHGIVAETSWSFPSGHAGGSMLVYGLLAYLLVRYTKAAWHIPIALAGITLIILVGASRVILHVHYLSDVLAGYVSAGAWVALWIAALEAIRWSERNMQQQHRSNSNP